MPQGMYLIENKPIAVCFQIVLEFVIFLTASTLWLTWCTQHVQLHNESEATSLAFSLPGYVIGWVCLMMTRFTGSRLKEKFCFSFYLASGIRFMWSGAILFPEFSRYWYSVAYGVISLLCFVNTIFHIVTQTTPETRPVRQLLALDGTLREDPAMENMTIQQLEKYKDVVRNYMENRKPSEEPSEHSAKVINVPLVPLASAKDEAPQLKDEEDDISLSSSSLGLIPGTTRRYSGLRLSDITIVGDDAESILKVAEEQSTKGVRLESSEVQKCANLAKATRVHIVPCPIHGQKLRPNCPLHN